MTGQTEFLGRLDTQLKVRGHRVEVQAVEDILQTQVPEIETAVLDYQNEELVAFIVAPALRTGELPDVVAVDPDWAKRLTVLLAEQLPAPSVPSRLFLITRFVLNPRSGKIERSQLPKLTDRLPGPEARVAHAGAGATTTASLVTHRAIDSHNDQYADPADDEALSICRTLLGRSLGWDDAFADHGAHSILIAQLAQSLRRAGWSIPVSALLSDCDTARKITARPKQTRSVASGAAQTHRQNGSRNEAAAQVLSVPGFTLRQILFLLVLYAPHLAGFLAVVSYGEIGSFFLTTGYWGFIVVGFLLYTVALAWPFVTLLWVMTIQTCLNATGLRDTPTPGTYPKWSRVHLRVWGAGRLQDAVLRPLFAVFRSPRLTAFVRRWLGARIGQHTECANDIRFNGPLELLCIEDEVAVQTAAHIQMIRWVGQTLEIGTVRLERGCKIGMQASVGHSVVIGAGAWVTPLTPVFGDVGSGEIWEGAPARSVGQCKKLRRPERHVRTSLPPWCEEAVNIAMQSLLDFLLLVAPASTVIWGARFLLPYDGAEPMEDGALTAPLGEVIGHVTLYALATTWVGLVLSSVLACLFLRVTKASPGLYPSRGPMGALLLYRQRLMDQIQRIWTWTIIGQYLRALAGLRFSRCGGSECDVMLGLVPETATAAANVFWAHGSFTNMLDQDAGRLTLRQLEMPTNFFAGNNCVAEDGHYPTNFLLGVSSPCSGNAYRRQLRSRLGPSITVAGNPPIRFASADFEAERHRQTLPDFPLFLGRILLNDILSVGFLRTTDFVVYIVLYTVLLRFGGDYLLSAIAALLLTEVALIFACVALKRLLVGRSWGQDHATPFWSWRHFTYFFVQDCFFAWCGTQSRVAAGTLLPNVILRRFGCEIGARALIPSPLQAFDWNAVKIGDDAIVDGMLQYHSLENMTLTVKETRIGDGAAINSGATLMGGAMIDPGTTMLPLSLVLKEMNLPTDIYWGSPVEPAEEDPETTTQDVRHVAKLT